MPPSAGYNRPADTPPPSYSIVGSSSEKAFNVCLALGTVAFAFGDTVLPEVQVRNLSSTKSIFHASPRSGYAAPAPVPARPPPALNGTGMHSAELPAL